MSPAQTTSLECTLSLTGEERTQLLSLLEQTLRDKLVEVHRTDSLDFRQHVQRQANVLSAVIDKLRGP